MFPADSIAAPIINNPTDPSSWLQSFIIFISGSGFLGVIGGIFLFLKNKKEVQQMDVGIDKGKQEIKHSNFETIINKYSDLEQKISNKLEEAEKKINKILTENENLKEIIMEMNSMIFQLLAYSKNLDSFADQVCKIIKKNNDLIKDNKEILNDRPEKISYSELNKALQEIKNKKT